MNAWLLWFEGILEYHWGCEQCCHQPKALLLLELGWLERGKQGGTAYPYADDDLPTVNQMFSMVSNIHGNSTSF